MTLREKQAMFCWYIGELINRAFIDGYELTFGEAYRGDKQGHMQGSLHYERLAIDLNLFVNGKWQDRDCPEWQELGAYWKSLHPLARWGGDFAEKDLNHFSFAHGKKA